MGFIRSIQFIMASVLKLETREGDMVYCFPDKDYRALTFICTSGLAQLPRSGCKEVRYIPFTGKKIISKSYKYGQSNVMIVL